MCNREADEKGGYCELHAKAYENIMHKYESWKKALNIAWNDYLTEVLKSPLTGVSAKEVAQQLLSKN